MRYDDDPVVVAFARRFRETENGFHFALAGTAYRLPVSESDYFEGLERARLLGAVAGTVGMGAAVAALILALWQWMHGAGMGGIAVLLFVGGSVIRGAASIIAVQIATTPFRRRTLAEVRERRAWQRRGIVRGFGKSGLPAVILLIFVGATALAAWVINDHNRRLDLLAKGASSEAVVVFSGMERTHCRLDFRLDYGGRAYPGTTTQCAIMGSHLAGSRIAVKYDPQHPAGVIAVGDSSWNALAAVPVMLLPLLILILALGLVPNILGYAPARRRAGSRPHR